MAHKNLCDHVNSIDSLNLWIIDPLRVSSNCKDSHIQTYREIHAHTERKKSKEELKWQTKNPAPHKGLHMCIGMLLYKRINFRHAAHSLLTPKLQSGAHDQRMKRKRRFYLQQMNKRERKLNQLSLLKDKCAVIWWKYRINEEKHAKLYLYFVFYT